MPRTPSTPAARAVLCLLLAVHGAAAATAVLQPLQPPRSGGTPTHLVHLAPHESLNRTTRSAALEGRPARSRNETSEPPPVAARAFAVHWNIVGASQGARDTWGSWPGGSLEPLGVFLSQPAPLCGVQAGIYIHTKLKGRHSEDSI